MSRTPNQLVTNTPHPLILSLSKDGLSMSATK